MPKYSDIGQKIKVITVVTISILTKNLLNVNEYLSTVYRIRIGLLVHEIFAMASFSTVNVIKLCIYRMVALPHMAYCATPFRGIVNTVQMHHFVENRICIAAMVSIW